MILEKIRDRISEAQSRTEDVEIKNTLIYATKGFDCLHEMKQIIHKWNIFNMSEHDALCKLYNLVKEVEDSFTA